MTAHDDINLALRMRDRFADAIRVPRDPKANMTSRLNIEHAKAIAEYLIREGLVDLAALEEVTRGEPDEDDDDLLIE